jgi:Spy/CpxP family protein refolding chaperone
MADEEGNGQETDSTAIANELIEFANDKQETGVDALVIAAALRHAAANFTAFAFRATEGPLDTNDLMEEFIQFLQYYDGHHRSRARQMTPLEKLVKQVEDE